MDTKHVYNNTDLQQCQIERGGEQAGSVLETDHSRVDRAEQEITVSSGVYCRLGSGPATSWWKSTWNWNVLTTWPIQSVINEAPLLCAREGKKGILTNCADTARLVGRSRCCKSVMSRRLVQSSLANLFVSHEVCLWNVSIQEDSVCSCNLLDDEEATAFPSEEDEAMREWRQEFPEQLRRVVVRIHTNLGHPHKFDTHKDDFRCWWK